MTPENVHALAIEFLEKEPFSTMENNKQVESLLPEEFIETGKSVVNAYRTNVTPLPEEFREKEILVAQDKAVANLYTVSVWSIYRIGPFFNHSSEWARRRLVKAGVQRRRVGNPVFTKGKNKFQK